MMEKTGGAMRGGDLANGKQADGKGMSPETKTVLTVITIAALVFAVYVWGFSKDGVPSYSLWLVAGFIVLFTVLTLKNLLPDAEEKLARRLAAGGTAQSVMGKVMEMRRRGSLETTTHRYSYVTLIVDMEAEGATRSVSLRVKIEEGLLPGFASGKHIHLLYDPADPANVAIDREKNPVSIE